MSSAEYFRVCVSCGNTRPHHGYGLCDGCYTYHRATGTLGQFPRLAVAHGTPGCYAAGCRMGACVAAASLAVTRAPAPAGNWAARAACAGEEPDLFFPPPGGDSARAKAVCRKCPVIAACLADALASDGQWGVAG